MLEVNNFINGAFVPPQSGKFLENIGPASGKIIAKIPRSDKADVTIAIQSAKKAFESWSKTLIEERAELLNEIADQIESNSSELAELETLDTGKPINLSKSVDIPRAAKNFRFFASAIQQFSSEFNRTSEDVFNYTLRQPLGVVACISPWNLPIYLLSWKIAPALAAGNTVVAKPSELTPLTADYLAKLCHSAGIPDGVLNILHGLGGEVGQSLVEHSEVRAISFTGGTKTGKQISQSTAGSFKKLSLELGGKNANIIFSDCDIDNAVKTSVRSSFTNQGQICLCGSRIFIQEDMYGRFKEKFIDLVEALKEGDPKEDSTQIGALISREHLKKVSGYVKLAKEEGGTVLTGGQRIDLNGYFFQPTVIEGLNHQCRTNQEEIFGPVVTLTPFKDEPEVIEYANSTKYGLSASIWTTDLNKAHRVSAKIEAGVIWVNCWLVRDLRTPFGGLKESGVGREGGYDSLSFFTEKKNICINIGP
ncbi:MAG: aldehyde dehydrogenase [Bacteroidota bacterium]